MWLSMCSDSGQNNVDPYHLSLLYKEKLPVVLCRSGAELPSDVSQLQHFYPIIVMHGAELVIRYLYCN